MSKATAIYVIMIVAFVGGLWFILALGSTLVPPTDLGGKWELTGPSGTQSLAVEQSGKFVDLSMPNWTSNLKIQSDGNKESAGKNSIDMIGNNQTVRFEGLGINDQCTIRFDGSLAGVYQAHRVVKAFK